MKYALRANFFGYNDEYYNLYDCGDAGRICGIYPDLATATNAWKTLEYQTIAQRPLANTTEFCESSPERLQELDAFVFTCCGEHIAEKYHENYYVMEDCENTIAKMSVEQVFEFVTKADFCSYKLVEYDDSTKICVCWLPEKNSHLFSRDYYGDDDDFLLCQGASAAEIFDYYYHNIIPYGQAFTLTGTLSELSATPEILRSLIAAEPTIDYSEELQILSLRDLQAFKLVCPLLLNPPCAVREVSLEEAFEIQQRELPIWRELTDEDEDY